MHRLRDVYGNNGAISEGVEASVSEIEVPKVGVKGRLRQCLPLWREVINASPTVLSVIEHGYVLPLLAEPTPLGVTTQHMRMQNLCEIL